MFVYFRTCQFHHRHAVFNTVLQIQITVNIIRGPEIDAIYGVINRSQAVDAAHSLNNPDRIPVDVVVDDIITILQVLAFAQTVGSNQYVNRVVQLFFDMRIRLANPFFPFLILFKR